jgi:hypothetical protein
MHRYKEVLVLLLNELLQKIQFHHNPTLLEELDDQVVDDDVRAVIPVLLTRN